MRWVLRVPTVVVALAASAIAFAAPFGGVIAAEKSFDGCERSVGDEEHAQRLREEVGLAIGADLVAATYSLRGYSCELAGIPLSAYEEDAFLDVLDAQGQLSDLLESVAGDPTFAGAWLDAGVLTIASTDGRLGGDLQPEKGSIALRAAHFTNAELEAAAAEIGGLTEDSAIGPFAASITYVAVDVRANRVKVGVAADVEKAAPVFAQTYGHLVSVYFAEPVEGGFLACTEDDCGTKGGLAMDHDGPAVGCTSGFLSKSKLHAGSTYSRRILTAGHCIYGAGGISNTNNWHNPDFTQTWGDNYAMDFQQYEYADGTQWCPVQNTICLHNDLGLIVVGSNPPTDWNQYFTGSGTFIEIDGRTSKANQLVGQIVYRYGRTSNLDAGAITAKPTYITITGTDCAGAPACRNYNVIEVGVGSDHGDSGSGFYRVQSNGSGGYTRNAYGILSGGVTGEAYTYYYSWDEPFYAGSFKTDRRTVYPCISTSCPL